MFTLEERVLQYKAGLINRKELQRFIDVDNMGNDYYFVSYNDSTGKLER